MVLGPPRRAKAARARSARPATRAAPPGSWRPARTSGCGPRLPRETRSRRLHPV